MLVDTNIFIDFLKGNTSAKQFFQEKTLLSTSILVLMEVIVGLPKQSDIKVFEKFIRSTKIHIHPVTEQVSDRAYQLLTRYYHATRIGIADAFVAATANVHGEELTTLNIKHYRAVKEISVIKPY